jgi:hypothetical protein
LAILAGSLVACNNTTDTTTTTSDSVTLTNENTGQAYRPVEGDVTNRGGRVMVYRNNNWVEADRDVDMDGGIIVRRDGRVVRNNEEIELREGEVVTRTGRILDKTGNAIEKGWDETKEGVKKGYNKVKEGVKETVRDTTR